MDIVQTNIKNHKPFTFKTIPVFKETNKGYRYKIGNYKKRTTGNLSVNSGSLVTFNDYGDKCNLQILNYTPLFDTKKVQSKTSYNSNRTDIWFYIKNGQLVIKRKINPTATFSRNISGNNEAVLNSFYIKSKDRKKGRQKFITLLKAWARRNGIEFKKRWNKYSYSQLLYILSYPGIENFFEIYNFTKLNSSSGEFSGGNTYSTISSYLTKDLKNSIRLNNLLDKIYGHHGKKLKESFKTLPMRNIYTDKLLKDLVDKDFIINHKLRLPEYKYNRRFLRKFSSETLKAWFTILIESRRNSHYLVDTLMMYSNNHNRLVLPDSNDLEEIHNSFARQLGRRQPNNQISGQPIPRENIDYSKFLEPYSEIQGFTLDDLKIEIPQSSDKLIEYSEKMGNCIAGYDRYIPNGGLLFGIYKKDELKYNISIRNKVIEQFYGKFNNPPDDIDKEKITNFLVEKDIIKKPIKLESGPMINFAPVMRILPVEENALLF